MASAALVACQKYLHEASRLLVCSAASTSASIGSVHNRMCLHRGITAAEFCKNENCGCCGTPLIPGRQCRVTLAPANKPRANVRKNSIRKHSSLRPGGQGKDRVLVYRCGKCNRETRCPMEKKIGSTSSTSEQTAPAPQHLSRSMLNTTVNLQPPEAQVTPVLSDTLPTQAGSRKRRQVKKQGALHAMLIKTRTDLFVMNNDEFALMDFMKSG